MCGEGRDILEIRWEGVVKWYDEERADFGDDSFFVDVVERK